MSSARSGMHPRLHVVEIDGLHLGEWSVVADRAFVQVDGATAEALEQRVVMTGCDDDASRVDERPRPLLDDGPELVVQGLVDLVEQQDARLRLLRDCEAESRTHPLRVRRDWILERVAEAAPLFDRLERALRPFTRQPSEHTQQQRILTPG